MTKAYKDNLDRKESRVSKGYVNIDTEENIFYIVYSTTFKQNIGSKGEKVYCRQCLHQIVNWSLSLSLYHNQGLQGRKGDTGPDGPIGKKGARKCDKNMHSSSWKHEKYAI